MQKEREEERGKVGEVRKGRICRRTEKKKG
jgi:hypothetical protein